MSTIKEIPLPPDTALFTIQANLSGIDYVLLFDYSGKEDRFYLSILDASGEMLRSGIKVLCNWNVLRQWRGEGRPAGALIFSDGKETPPEGPGWGELGRSVRLYYVSE